MKTSSYSLIDSGNGAKLERFGKVVLSRPCAQAFWKPQLAKEQWEKADAVFTRESETRWQKNAGVKESWNMEVSGITFKISPTDFGHLGIFPEQCTFWSWIQETIKNALQSRWESVNVLNLFAYSGGSTLAAASAGAKVCHLDASKGMVAWARENAVLSGLEKAPIRWIVEDAVKFLKREIQRGVRYDAIILDPPTFGRGKQGEVFKIEEDLIPILHLCRELLTKNPLFILFSCHTPGFTPLVMRHLTQQVFGKIGHGVIDEGEMILEGEKTVFPVPSGTYARWQCAS